MVAERELAELLRGKEDDPDIISFLSEKAALITAESGEMIYEDGRKSNDSLLFLKKGLVRTYTYQPCGEEITDSFICKKRQIIKGCFDFGEVTTLNVEALVRSEILRIPLVSVKEVVEKCPYFYHVVIEWMSELLERHLDEKMMMHYRTAYERVQWLQSRYPNLWDTVPNRHIASFLNMTPVTLSRMRRKCREEMENNKSDTVD